MSYNCVYEMNELKEIPKIIFFICICKLFKFINQKPETKFYICCQYKTEWRK